MRRVVLSFCCLLLSTQLAAAHQQYRSYLLDGTSQEVPVFDSLVTVLVDTSEYAFNAESLAVTLEYLQSDFDITISPSGMYIFGINAGFQLDTVMTVLREIDHVSLVNPVVSCSGDREAYLGDRLIVVYKEFAGPYERDSLEQVFGLTVVDTLDTELGILALRYDGLSRTDILTVARQYFETGFCTISEANMSWYGGFLGDPNDPYYGLQWHFKNTGQTGGTADADIDWDEGEDFAIQGHSTIVAVIDGCFEEEHQDLDDIWAVYPYDAVGRDINNPEPDTDPSCACSDTLISCYHATAVMGVIKAITSNDSGLAGLRCDVAIMPVKMVDNRGASSANSLIESLKWVRQSHGGLRAHICNISMCIAGYSSGVELELQSMYESGQSIFCAAGNDRDYLEYPASSPWVIAVGLTDQDDLVDSISARGPELDVIAPGTDIWSLDRSWEYGMNPGKDTCNGDPHYACHLRGSSMASPMAAGIAAKLFQVRPEMFDPYHGWMDSAAQKVFSIIRYSSEREQYGGNDTSRVSDSVGWGRVNAARAILAVVRGDADNNGYINTADATYIIAYVMGGGPSPQPTLGIGDVDCSGTVNIADAVYIIGYIFGGGAAPKICYEYDY